LRDCHKSCRVCTPFQYVLAVKIWLDLLEGLWSYGGFKLRGLIAPKFSAHPIGRTMHQTILEVQERAGGPVSPCQVWWGWDLLERLWSYGGFKLVCTPFQYVLAVKIWSDLLEGLWSYGGCKLRGLVAPKFSAHRSGKTMHQTVLEVQERAGGPVSPYQVW